MSKTIVKLFLACIFITSSMCLRAQILLYPPVHYYNFMNPYAMISGDFNQDSILDLAIAHESVDSFSISLGVGNGTFLPSTAFAAGNQPLGIQAADFDGDSILDMVTCNALGDNFALSIGNGNGSFKIPTYFQTADFPTGIAVADLNLDGKMDVVTCHGAIESITVRLGNGNGSFSPQAYYYGQAFQSAVTIADFNHDSLPDIATTGNSCLNVFMGKGGGLFDSAKVNIGTSFMRSLCHADLNQDGHEDIAICDYYLHNGMQYLGDGNGNFSSPQGFAAGYQPTSIEAEDLDGDGKKELIVANYLSGISAIRNLGNGSLSAPDSFTTGLLPRDIVCEDFNKDGKMDIATANSGGQGFSILLGGGYPANLNSLHHPVPVHIYPNPCKQQCMVDCACGEAHQIFLLNQLGQLVANQQLPTGDFQINFPELPAGVYNLQIIHKEQPVFNSLLQIK